MTSRLLTTSKIYKDTPTERDSSKRDGHKLYQTKQDKLGQMNVTKLTTNVPDSYI